MHITRFALLISVVAATTIGCGDGDSAAPKVHTTDAGTVIVGTTVKEAGLEVEIQDDSLYVDLAADAPKAAHDLAGKPLGGACVVDGRGGVRVARQFPIYWRAEYRNWGTAVVRDPIGADTKEKLAEHVTSCRIFATKPTGAPGESSFNEATDAAFATVKLR
jgi:hypothetical protein